MVETIDYYALAYSKNLKRREIPNSVKTIGEYAFHHCENLTSIEIPKSVTTIEHPAFLEDRCFVIQGVTDSYAEIYAKENNIKFEGIE